jgi:hypothetical protein
MVTIERGGGRPARYKNKDGKIVPSVTTICSRYKDSGGLIQWAYKQGLEGKQLHEQVKEAGDIGAAVHDWIEHDICDDPLRLPEDPKIRSGIEAWLKWRDRWIERFIAVEVPLVSEALQIGGTFDALGIESKTANVVLLDWKTSGGIYPEVLMQVAAYAMLLQECRGIEVKGFHIVRFSKEYADLEHRHYDQLEDARALFYLYRAAYDLAKQVAKRAK